MCTLFRGAKYAWIERNITFEPWLQKNGLNKNKSWKKEICLFKVCLSTWKICNYCLFERIIFTPKYKCATPHTHTYTHTHTIKSEPKFSFDVQSVVHLLCLDQTHLIPSNFSWGIRFTDIPSSQIIFFKSSHAGMQYFQLLKEQKLWQGDLLKYSTQ